MTPPPQVLELSLAPFTITLQQYYCNYINSLSRLTVIVCNIFITYFDTVFSCLDIDEKNLSKLFLEFYNQTMKRS